MSARNTVCIISSNTSLINSLKNGIKSSGLTLVTFNSVRDFLPTQVEEPTVGCVVAELSNGLDVLKELSNANRLLPVVLLAGGGSLASAVQAMKAGAYDVVEKAEAAAESAKKGAGQFAKYQKLAGERALALQRIDSLTNRETQVFSLMVQGLPNRQIAEQLVISNKTLDIHRANMMEKMEARTPADLVRAHLLHEVNPMLLPQVLG